LADRRAIVRRPAEGRFGVKTGEMREKRVLILAHIIIDLP
jgi:hypothetical protein